MRFAKPRGSRQTNGVLGYADLIYRVVGQTRAHGQSRSGDGRRSDSHVWRRLRPAARRETRRPRGGAGTADGSGPGARRTLHGGPAHRHPGLSLRHFGSWSPESFRARSPALGQGARQGPRRVPQPAPAQRSAARQDQHSAPLRLGRAPLRPLPRFWTGNIPALISSTSTSRSSTRKGRKSATLPRNSFQTMG